MDMHPDTPSSPFVPGDVVFSSGWRVLAARGVPGSTALEGGTTKRVVFRDATAFVVAVRRVYDGFSEESYSMFKAAVLLDREVLWFDTVWLRRWSMTSERDTEAE